MVIDCWEKERETGEEKETIAMQEHATVSAAVSSYQRSLVLQGESYEKKIDLPRTMVF